MKESRNIEWKQAWRDEYLKGICGFANAEGSVLDISHMKKLNLLERVGADKDGRWEAIE